MVPCRPVTAPGAAALSDGVALGEAATATGGEVDRRQAGRSGHVVPADALPCRPVTVTPADALSDGVALGEAATATGGEVDCRQAARASRPSNAGRGTL
jgi:hypothetical protein